MNFEEPKRDYKRISDSQRVNLLRRVLIHQEQLKSTAFDLGIKYPTAKKIMRDYRSWNVRPNIGLEEFTSLDVSSYPEALKNLLPPPPIIGSN
jgi:hypothetical protein